MNITEGYIFIKAEAPHECIIVYESAEINDMMDEMDYVFVGTCQYDSEHNIIKELDRR